MSFIPNIAPSRGKLNTVGKLSMFDDSSSDEDDFPNYDFNSEDESGDDSEDESGDDSEEESSEENDKAYKRGKKMAKQLSNIAPSRGSPFPGRPAVPPPPMKPQLNIIRTAPSMLPSPQLPTMPSPQLPVFPMPPRPVTTAKLPTTQMSFRPSTTLPQVKIATKPVSTSPTLVFPQQAQIPSTKLNVEEILSKMQGITISGVVPAPAIVPTDINDLLTKEADETLEDFDARKKLTLILSNIPDYPLNNLTAVTCGFMIMKKSKLGVTYDPDVESALTYLMSLMKR